MNSIEESNFNEEPSCAISSIEHEKSANIVKRPSFVVKRVNENELINQSNSIPLKTTTTTNLYESLSSASSTSSSNELNSYNDPILLPNFRKQSIRYSCRLHCHHHHQHQQHGQENYQNNNKKSKASIDQLIVPYYIWKKRFMDSHQCNEKDFWPTFMMSLIPNIVKLFLGISYIVIGALIFQEIDPTLSKESFPDMLLFTFTSVTTIGYGSIVPSTKASIIFSIFYICCGVPTVFLVLSNFSEMIAEFYWILFATFQCQKELETDHPHHLPVPIAMLLILGHSAIGSLLFSWIMPDLDYVDTFYFSFISITTIGFGDISPKTSSLSESIIIITYLSIGIIILSAFIGSLTVVIRRIHYIGRSFEGAEYVEVYFGGSKFTIAELLEIVSEQFNVTPNQLREVIQELDELINIAVDEPQVEHLHGPDGEDIELSPTTRENQQALSLSVNSKQTNYTSRFSDTEQIKLIQAVGTMCHLSQSGKKSFRSGVPSIMQHYQSLSNPPIQHHSSIPNAFKKRSLSTENTKINNHSYHHE